MEPQPKGSSWTQSKLDSWTKESIWTRGRVDWLVEVSEQVEVKGLAEVDGIGDKYGLGTVGGPGVVGRIREGTWTWKSIWTRGGIDWLGDISGLEALLRPLMKILMDFWTTWLVRWGTISKRNNHETSVLFLVRLWSESCLYSGNKALLLGSLMHKHGAVRGSGQGLFPLRMCPPLISRGVMA